eukprot:gene664-1117_t
MLKQATRLNSWLRAEGASGGFEVGVSRLGGYGLFASRRLEIGDTVMDLPGRLVIGQGGRPAAIGSPIEDGLLAGATAALESVESRTDDAGAGAGVLALHLLAEVDRALNASAGLNFAPWLAALPTRAQPAWRWSVEQQQLLLPTSVASKAGGIATQVVREHAAVLESAPRALGLDTSLARYTWAQLMVRSRSFPMAFGQEGVRLAFRPGADFANHCATAVGEPFQDPLTGRMMLIAESELEVGEEFCINYGRFLSSGNMLIGYGFADGSRTHDSCNHMFDFKRADGSNGQFEATLLDNGHPEDSTWDIDEVSPFSGLYSNDLICLELLQCAEGHPDGVRAGLAMIKAQCDTHHCHPQQRCPEDPASELQAEVQAHVVVVAAAHARALEQLSSALEMRLLQLPS